jgi:hypothetical protein
MLLRTMNLSPYIAGLMRVAGSLRELGPYAVVAVIVPGGCLIALVLWAFRNRTSLVGRWRTWQELQKSRSGFGFDRIRLDRITAICEATHSWLGPHTFAHPADAMVFLRAGSAAESQRAGTA